MLMGLVLCAFERSDNVLFAIDDSGTFGVKMLPASSEVIIEPQRQIGDYRVDFLVSWTETNWATANTRSEPPTQITTFLIVECDGHEYHERTKEQAKRDKGRDRILQSCGYSVFRFTGSEIYKDVIKCANSAIQFIEKKSKEQVYSK
jgi:very-short-patch-repair endonuclease